MLNAAHNTILNAAHLIQQWNVVAFPTETIYGLFADATNPEAVAKIFIAKNRPSDNPLIVHCAYANDIEICAIIENDIQQLLIDKLMPWPFTLILPKKDIIPSITTGNLDTVCVRIPDNAISRSIIHEVGVPLAWPSANISWRPSPTSADMVLKDMNGRIPLIVDWWKTLYGIESTVVKVYQESGSFYISILRPWFITKEDIEYIVWDQAIVVYNDTWVNESPWTKYRHYSPLAKVNLISSSQDIQLWGFSDTNKFALIVTQEFVDENQTYIGQISQSYNITVMILWSLDNLTECAKNLYQLYARCDELFIDHIFIETLPEQWIWYALMNRIRKSL